jgi:hypothetical protein
MNRAYEANHVVGLVKDGLGAVDGLGILGDVPLPAQIKTSLILAVAVGLAGLTKKLLDLPATAIDNIVKAMKVKGEAPIEPYEGHVFDPCCDSAGTFVRSERFIEAHGGQRTNISIFGQESNPTTSRLARINLAARRIEADVGSRLHLAPGSWGLSQDATMGESPRWR